MTMTTVAGRADSQTRHGTIDPLRTTKPAALIFNPHAGQKLGLAVNNSGSDAVTEALSEAGIPFDAWPTERAGHATELARQAVAEGRDLVIAAGGDGTVAEVAHGLANTGVTLGVMPLGSIMNMARTLCVPRDLAQAARTIREGRVLAMDMGRVGDRYFLEAAGVGLDAGLFAYFDRVDHGRGSVRGALRGAFRFMAALGTPRVVVEGDDWRYDVRAPMITIANSKFVGAAYVVAPEARIDDGLFDVLVFRGAGVLRILLHLAMVAGGRQLPPPPTVYTARTRRVKIQVRRSRPLPVHADGQVAGITPVELTVEPAALRVIVGTPDPDAACAWEYPSVPIPTPDGTAV